jgi:cytochrome c-type biogenesis protein CcmH
VKLVFFVVVALMVLLAIAVVAVPLLRRSRQQGRSRRVFAVALFVIVAVPLATLGLYVKIGAPATLDGVAAQPPAVTIDQALADLRAHLAQQPDDLQGWLLLAQTTTAMHQPAAARDAYDHVLKIDAGNTDAMVGWAEADSMLQTDHVIGKRARQLLQQAVNKQPDNQRGLWLLGIGQFQQNEFADAALTWRHLLPLLQPGSAVADAVADQIKAADTRSGVAPAPKGATPAQRRDPSQGPALTVDVRLAPALSARVAPGDTLFIYARAPSGPPMPLAVTRTAASALPVSVTLTDAMAMTPQHALSSAARVFVGARISHRGQAIAQPGDLEGDAGVLAVDATQPILITIDKVH